MKVPELAHCHGALPRRDNPGARPLIRITPIQPTMAKEKAIGIPEAMNKKKAARPMKNTIRGDKSIAPSHLVKELNYLDNQYRANK